MNALQTLALTLWAMIIAAPIATPTEQPIESIVTERQALSIAIERRMQIPWYADRGKAVHWKACRKAPGGCAAHIETITGYIIDAGEEHGIDPTILAAMAWSESRYNPFSEGGIGERGVFQVSPRSGRGLAFFRKGREGDRYRKACRKEVGACQLAVVIHAASRLAARQRKCGSIEGALSGYNTGSCTSDRGAFYSRRILRLAGDLRHEINVLTGGA